MHGQRRFRVLLIGMMIAQLVLAPLAFTSQPSARASGPASSGTICWHAHYSVSFAAGLAASVDLSDGHVDVSASDLSIPARGYDLSLGHTWDSTRGVAGTSTSAGQGWSTTLTAAMSGAPGSTVTYTDGSGAAWVFPFSGSAYTIPAGLPWTLSASGSGYTLTNFLTGEVKSFDSSGRFSSDTDSYGNANTLTQGASGPTSDANSGGRSLTLAYSSNLLSDVKSPLYVSSAGAQGQHLTYGYSGSQLTGLTWGAATSDAVSAHFAFTGNLLTTLTTGAVRAWTLGYTSNQLTSITSPISGTLGQLGYTPAYSTLISYSAGQAVVTMGNGTSGALTTTYSLDTNGQPTKVQDALGHNDQYTYDANHDVLTHTDGNNNVTTNKYLAVGPNASVGLLSEIDRAQIHSPLPGKPGASVITNRYDSTTHDLLETDNNNTYFDPSNHQILRGEHALHL